MTTQPEPGPRTPGGSALLVACLVLLAGITDAIGLLGLGHYASYMSGNTTDLGVALVAQQWRRAGDGALVIVCFMAGAALGEAVGQRAARRQAAVLAAVATLLTASCTLLLLGEPRGALLVTVGAMGLLNAAYEKSQGQSIGLTYMTGALVHFSQAIGRWAVTGQAPAGLRLNGAIVGGILAGAIAGAALYHGYGDYAIAVPTVLAWVLAALALRWRGDPGPSR
jgi:uncharacterized membrane protein YoaK (UPF0700 family)